MKYLKKIFFGLFLTFTEVRYPEIADKIENGAKPQDFAVLFRTNSQSLAIETKITEQGIPDIMNKGLGFFDREEIKAVIAYLRLIHNPYAGAAFERVCSYPKRGIGEKKIGQFKYKVASEGYTYLEAMSEDSNKGCKNLSEIRSSSPARYLANARR